MFLKLVKDYYVDRFKIWKYSYFLFIKTNLKTKIFKYKFHFLLRLCGKKEFDPGSEWTLAIYFTHVS